MGWNANDSNVVPPRAVVILGKISTCREHSTERPHHHCHLQSWCLRALSVSPCPRHPSFFPTSPQILLRFPWKYLPNPSSPFHPHLNCLAWFTQNVPWTIQGPWLLSLLQSPQSTPHRAPGGSGAPPQRSNHTLRWSLPPSVKTQCLGTSLVAQWLRIHLPMQGTQVRALVREDPTCRGATRPVCHNYWAWDPQLLKPVHLEPVLHNKRSHRNEKTTRRN